MKRKHIFTGLLIVALLGLLWPSLATHAATITVTTIADVLDAAGACNVVTVASLPGPDGVTSLREAMCAAVYTAGPDTIGFNIPGCGGVCTIRPTSALPALTSSGTTIDGYTQPGASPATASTPAVLMIEIDGTNAGPVMTHGLKIESVSNIESANNSISGLAINRFKGHGIRISGSYATGNSIWGNHIGTDPSGAIGRGNSYYGIALEYGPHNNVIGGDEPEERNIISNNGGRGISLERPGTANNIISGNYIGTNASGTAALGNGNDGICFAVDAGNNVIGGDTAGERNIISGNGQYGIHLLGSDGNTVIGNYIGTNASGTIALRNVQEGILIGYGGENNTIGGDTPGERNVISGNGSRGVSIRNYSTTGNIISGNYIGTDTTGAFAVGNAMDGVLVSGNSENNRVERNVISGNKISGVYIDSNRNTVVDNYIGTDASGSAPLGNVYYGVDITAVGTGTRNNTIGPGNLIAHNVQDGVVVRSSASVGHVITRNSIFANRMGIDLRDGSNGGIAAPVINHTTVGPGTVTVVGTACPGCTVELFENSNTDGEGETYAGYAIADSGGVFSIAVSSLNKLYLTATATDPVKGTSEFSAVYTATYPDLSASVKSVDKATVAPGEVLIYTIRLINGGTGPATAILTDSLPDEVTWENEYSASAGTLTWDEENRRLTWIGTVTVGTEVTIIYQVSVNTGVSVGTEITNNASVDDGTGVVSELGPPITTVLNVPPFTVDDAYEIVEDSLLTITAPGVLANDTDPNADALTAAQGGDPANGTLVLGADGSFAYQPTADYCGSDAFTYTASDGHGGTASASVSITVTCVNDNPVAADDNYVANEDAPLTIVAPGVLSNDSDADGDLLLAFLVSGPANGTLTLGSDGSFSYTPTPGFYGADSFSYEANDGTANSDPALVAITVNPVNDSPTADDDSAATDEDMATTIAVLANDGDVDGDSLTVASVTQGEHGAVTNHDANVTYAPDADYCGSDAFTYTASDGHGGTASATVNVTVTCVNDNPVAVDDAYGVDEDETLSVATPGVLANDGDAEGDPLVAVLISGSANGTLTLNPDGSFAYQPAADCCGSDAFTYTASDGHGTSDPVTVSVTVTCVNDSPVAIDDSATTDEDLATTVAVLVNDSDVDGDSLAVASVTDGAHGTVANNGADVTYTPAANFCGSDAFTYTASDGHSGTGAATVTINVACINDAPVAVADTYAAEQDTQLTIAAPGVLSNDSDIDGDSVSVDSYDSTSQAGGSVTISSDGSFTYTSADGFSGVDTFTYTIGDGNGGTDTATVSISVETVNQPPHAHAGGPYTVDEGSNVSLDGSHSSDPDPGATLTFEWDLDYEGMTFDVDITGVTPTFNAAGLDGPTSRTVALRVTDNAGASDIAGAVVTIVNVAPAVEPIAASLSPVPVGTTSDVSARFFDPCAADTHTAVWDWADGNITDGVVADATVSGSHIYAAPGVYVIRLTVTDDDGGVGEATFRYIVVYDPNGGFVTGGGWILSPASACRLTETCYAATGKANFGFVSKYKTGATVPTGNTEFQFHAGALNFHSTSYEWLVISGAKAMYKGIGAINGNGEYRFILTGIDAGINSHDVFDIDRFRIKIWYEDGQGQQVVVYDNGLDAEDGNDQATTEIGGGSIVIHNKK